MASKTILASFSRPHPKYPSSRDGKKVRPKGDSSSAVTGEEDVPMVLVRTSSDIYREKAETFLNSAAARHDATLNSPKIDPVHGNETEQDVVEITGAVILQPVLHAMNVIRPDLGLIPFSEDPMSNRLRVDHAIKTSRRKQNVDAMLIEYKRCWFIQRTQFEDAIRDHDEVQQAIIDLTQGNEDEDEETTLKPDSRAYVYVQQATAYRKRKNCRYVALCDYENLVLLRYTPDGRLTTVETTVVGRHEFAKVLLGFLMTACEDIPQGG